MRSSLKRLEPFHYYFLSFSSFWFSAVRPDHLLQSDHTTRPPEQPIRSASDQTTTTNNRRSLRSDHRSDHASTPTPDHRQTRPPKSAHQIKPPPPHQTSRSDQPNQQITILDCSTSNQHSTPNLLKWYRSGALFVSWVKGGYIELWMNLAKHTFHTRSAWSFRTSFSA